MFKKLFILVLISVLAPLSTQASTCSMRQRLDQQLLRLQVTVAILRHETPEAQKEYFCNAQKFVVSDGWQIDPHVAETYDTSKGVGYRWAEAVVDTALLQEYGVALYCWKGDEGRRGSTIIVGRVTLLYLGDVSVFNASSGPHFLSYAVYSLK